MNKALQKKAPIVITCGDPAGVGPDIIIKLFKKNVFPQRVAVIGDIDLFRSRAKMINIDISIKEYDSDASLQEGQLLVVPVALDVPVKAGSPDPKNTAYVVSCLNSAMQGCLSKRFAAMVTAPVSKEIINQAGVSFSGHTEFLAENSGGGLPVMVLTAGRLRVALVTTHLPLSEVSAAITPVRLEETLRILRAGLQKYLAISDPGIFVCGLNPHAGDGGYLGKEDMDIIYPVIKKLKKEGYSITGPLSADTIFSKENCEQADVFLAMYHDQGLPVLKYQGFGEAVNITLGLPFIRTSVDHGTAFALAGTGRASEASLHQAVLQAAEMIHNRNEQ